MSYIRHRPIRVLRPILVGVTVFVVAALAGMLLAGAATPQREPAPDRTVAVSRLTDTPSRVAAERARERRTFARSLVVSGAVGVTLSLSGLVMVARRRRRW